MGECQERNLATAAAFYSAGPAADDAERRSYFAKDFVWHVPGDTDLSADYSGDGYFVDMPARMQPLDEFHLDVEHMAANRDLVVTVARISGRRRGRALDVTGGHVLRFGDDGRIVEAWGWCADQPALDAFFADP